ncbi:MULTISPECIES: helix-turn-helix transcriptional regulator [Brevibacillus]|uniref:helix-turn-helix transcriptional regulator n=1 Tax=Brevibacillus TaxID=55080 RepID=UPI0007AB89EE|nr:MULTISPECIES: helix-turn-helix transcriptional regulator [Brevibacillus]KZE41995.1 transcriptional regulator [Brevibacillus parabrevis]MBU8714980.1 helix-turn-helix transcriptional regulator [Brevibacillus parabrevis]MDH6352988.1 CBS domain-containing protein/biotin operon repressor [Brevibacillus sp. 1238]MDR5000839.1 helix-turn-helix transcriptional regulator [Brevibacillus parabrevis]MED1725322.1 helix-turn-helix transcriptional regulator [Brevibacillus parabrevis]
MVIELTKRQEQILQIVKDDGPITGEHIAERLNLTRATLRPDLSILTMSGYLEARPRVGYFYAGRPASSVISERLHKLIVNDYKAVPIVVSESASAYDAIVTLFLEDVGTLFVVNQKGYLAGVISRKDLLRASLGNKTLEDVPVSIIMSRMPNIITCGPEETLYAAAKKLIDFQIDSLPVVRPSDEDPRQMELMGRVTKTTIAKAFVELGSEPKV